MNKRSKKSAPKTIKTTGRRGSHRPSGRLLSALLASGACSFLSTPSSALQLGELHVQSKLGQPLRASIAYALQPDERLSGHCIYLRPGGGSAGLQAVTQARLSLVNGRIVIQGTAPLREPLVSLGLSVNCPYTANLTRSYDLMLDPIDLQRLPGEGMPDEGATRLARIDPQPNAATTIATASVASVTQRPRAASMVAGTPIAPATSYRVQPGESLSTIASRIENRAIGLWPAVDLLFAENPDAFVDGDINKLKAGSLLTISNMSLAESVPAEPRIAEVSRPSPAPQVQATPAPISNPSASSTRSTMADLPAVTPAENTERPNSGRVHKIIVNSAGGTTMAPAASINPTATTTPRTINRVESPQPSALTYWLAAAGLLLISLGGLIVGITKNRRSRQRVGIGGSAGISSEVIADNEPTARNPAVPSIDFDMTEIAEISASQRTAMLDADLGDGYGLEGSEDIELNQDFAFSTTRDLGAEVDFPLSADEEDSSDTPTDVLPTHLAEQSTILEREVLPSEDDDRPTINETAGINLSANELDNLDITVRELETVAPGTNVELTTIVGSDEYTVDKEVDYQILEQDYEDEMTATQALNLEIMRAAEELQTRIQSAHSDESPTETIEAADNMSNELTAELPAVPTESRMSDNIEDTGATTELTVALPSAENDENAELNVETGRFSIGDTAS